jgi:hypothetical protein
MQGHMNVKWQRTVHDIRAIWRLMLETAPAELLSQLQSGN